MKTSKQIKEDIENLEIRLLGLTDTGKMTTKEFCKKTESATDWFYNWRNGTKKIGYKKILDMAEKLGM